MALHSAYSDAYVNKYLYYRLYVEEDSTSIDSNTSVVKWWVQVGRSNTGYTTTRTFSYSVNIGGNTASGSQKATVTHDPVTIGSGSFSVSHASDGTGSCSCAATVSSDSGTGYPSLTLSLTTIPRASTATVPTFTLGQAGTITIDRKSSSFTHTITFGYGKASGTIAEKTSATSVSYTFPESYAEYSGASTYGVGWVKVATYSGNTEIGANSYTLRCNIPDTMTPSVTGVTITDTNTDVPAVVGDGVFVENKSTLKVAVTAEGSNGSWISSRIVNAGGVSYSVGSDDTVTLPALSGTSVPVTITVIDSRGRSASVVQTVTQLAYQTPQLVSFNADRCDEDGTAKNDGNYVVAKFSYSISELNGKNAKSALVQYKRRSADSWTDLMDVTNGYAVTDGSAVSTIQVSADYQWDIRFCLKDSFADVDVDNLLPSAEVILDFKSDGKGVGIGKTAEESELVDCKWTFRGRGFQYTPDGDAVYDIDFVLASNISTTTASWSYIKWNNGNAVAWTTFNVPYGNANVLAYSPWFPFTFDTSYTVTATINDYGGNSAASLPRTVKVGKTSNSRIYISVQSSAGGFTSSTTLPVSIQIMGKWTQ